MTRGRRLVVVIAGAAALLLVGRGLSVVYVGWAWYAELGASSVWQGWIENTVLLYGGALVGGVAFVFGNLVAVRRSVVSLVVPARIGDVEIGEEVPSSRLTLITLGMSLGATAISTFALPPWTTLATWRSHVVFNEADPYFGEDLGFYVTWLPLESGVYVWAFVLFAIVLLLVVILYGLTPSLEWKDGRVYVTTHARRHLAVLGALLLMLVAWGFRLDAYGLLVRGSGDGGTFTHTDHTWLVPTDLGLSVVIIGVAVTLLAAGWVGQTRVALAAVTGVILCELVAQLLMPWISNVRAASTAGAARESAYKAVMRLYTARAFVPEFTPASVRFAADSALLAAAPRLRVQAPGSLPTVVYPGARGSIVEADPDWQILAPRIGDGTLFRLAGAWAEQNPHLLQASFPPDAVFIQRRDPRDRVAAIAPVFSQSRSVGVRPATTGLVWLVDLYTTSEGYPLSAARSVGGRRVTYRHHAATAYVNATTGGVTIVPDSLADPIAKAWFSSHPGGYLASAAPPQLLAPGPPRTMPSAGSAGTAGDAFRTRVLKMYNRMRAALRAGDLHAFGDAFDSLGAVVGGK